MAENDKRPTLVRPCAKGNAMTETITEATAEDYWKKPEQRDGEAITDPGVGIWSRSRALRLVVWIVTIIIVIFLSLVVSAYLSGFDSLFEMITWLRESLLKP
jgi:hypothetical protein